MSREADPGLMMRVSRGQAALQAAKGDLPDDSAYLDIWAGTDGKPVR
jgi:hypothetical protein